MTKKKTEIAIHSSAAEYLTYVASIGDNAHSMEMRYEDENIWLTQRMMAQLYDVSLPTINEHIKKIYDDSELVEEATIRKFRIVQTEGTRQVNREVIHYNLQMIIAVGFKVNNERAVRFRKWSGQIVKDYTIQGWTMDKERLKKGQSVNFTKRLLTYMLLLLIMIRMRGLPDVFSGPYKIKCIGLFIDIRQQNLLLNGLMRRRNTWDYLHGKQLQMEKL